VKPEAHTRVEATRSTNLDVCVCVQDVCVAAVVDVCVSMCGMPPLPSWLAGVQFSSTLPRERKELA